MTFGLQWFGNALFVMSLRLDSNGYVYKSLAFIALGWIGITGLENHHATDCEMMLEGLVSNVTSKGGVKFSTYSISTYSMLFGSMVISHFDDEAILNSFWLIMAYFGIR